MIAPPKNASDPTEMVRSSLSERSAGARVLHDAARQRGVVDPLAGTRPDEHRRDAHEQERAEDGGESEPRHDPTALHLGAAGVDRHGVAHGESVLRRSRVRARIVGVEPLDNPVWHTLCGPQATLAEGSGGARRFRPEYGPFAALADDPSDADWVALAEVVGAGGLALLVPVYEPPSGWQCLGTFAVRQMILPDSVAGALLDTPVPLTHTSAAHASSDSDPTTPTRWQCSSRPPSPARGRPGPMSSATSWASASTAGSSRWPASACGSPARPRLSAVCTDPVHRGHGYARTVVTAIAAVAAGAGTAPFCTWWRRTPPRSPCTRTSASGRGRSCTPGCIRPRRADGAARQVPVGSATSPRAVGHPRGTAGPGSRGRRRAPAPARCVCAASWRRTRW